MNYNIIHDVLSFLELENKVVIRDENQPIMEIKTLLNKHIEIKYLHEEKGNRYKITMTFENNKHTLILNENLLSDILEKLISQYDYIISGIITNRQGDKLFNNNMIPIKRMIMNYNTTGTVYRTFLNGEIFNYDNHILPYLPILKGLYYYQIEKLNNQSNTIDDDNNEVTQN